MATLPLPSVALAANTTNLLVSSGSSLIAWNLGSQSGQFVHPTESTSHLPHVQSVIRQIAISNDGSHAATYSGDKQLRVYQLDPPTLLSTRQAPKKCSDISFDPSGDIILSDKVGDTYRYPLDPRPAPEKRFTTTELTSDPSKNPDADILLGHVSVITAHVLTPDGKSIITADRDEHIRMSRYPDSFVVEKYLFGSNGFVSALHIPQSRPELLISAGGERSMRIWDWEKGVQVGSVDIWDAILPHRRVRSTMRKNKKGKKQKVDEEDALAGKDGGDFYDAPEGWMLPSGQGVCVKSIKSMEIDGETIVIFQSEGVAALHSFILPSDLSVGPSIHTLPLPYPLLDFAILPSSTGQILITLDPAFGVLRHNQNGSDTPKPETEVRAEVQEAMASSLHLVSVTKDGSLFLSTGENDMLSQLNKLRNDPTLCIQPRQNSQLQLYPNLSLYPRWPGLEEDDELAGTNEAQEESTPAPTTSVSSNPTREELEQLNSKQLGRLKAAGVDVGNLLSRKRLKKVAQEKRQAELGGAGAAGEEGDAKVGEDGAKQGGARKKSRRGGRREKKGKEAGKQEVVKEAEGATNE